MVSTLFLLKKTQRESASGRRFERLVNSIPLWLQILAVLLATWLLVQPRYVKAKSTQRIAIVLDSSASMQVFKNKLPETIQREISRLQGNAANIELWLVESDSAKEKIYQGDSSEELLLSLEKWEPTSGSLSYSNSLRLARSLVGAEGAITYITDTPPPNTAPYNSSIIAIGEPTDNCGFTGVSFETNGTDLIWKAIIRNYSDSEQTRSWKLKTPTAESKPKSITLAAGSLATIQGAFPKDQPHCQIQLTSDAFPLDDVLPLVAPSPKNLLVFSNLGKEMMPLRDKIISSFPNLQQVSETSKADLLITSTDTTPKSHNLLVFPQDRAKARPYLTGNLVAMKHPLTEGLNWQTLLVRESISILHEESDEVLLWQGNRALIYLRTHPTSGKKALILNFDIRRSNGTQQPALAVLMLRFCEELRNKKVASETRITETSEPLTIAHLSDTDSPSLIYQYSSPSGQKKEAKEISKNSLSAPTKPGFFTIRQGEIDLLTSASYFADTREANFSECATEDIPATQIATAVDRHTRDNHLWRIWVCLILAAIVAAWYFTQSKLNPSIS